MSWSEIHLREFPWRSAEDPYEIFIAEMLLQQTDAPRVVPVYKKFLERYPSLNSLCNASHEELLDLLRPLGFHFRASRLKEAACYLIQKYNGQIPAIESDLLSVPGVGLYVANSILANAFNQHSAVVDTNIVRIFSRFFGILSNYSRPRRDPFVWKFAQQIAPKHLTSIWNLSLIDFGAKVCKARSPQCDICPLNEKCYFIAANN